MGLNTDSLFSDIEKGRTGENMGIPTGIPVLDSKIYGIQKKSMITIGGLSGSAKSTFALYLLYNAYKERERFDFFKIVMYTLEMAPSALLAKLLSLHIYLETGEYITYKDILSLTSPISIEQYEMIQYYKPWIEGFEDFMVIYNDGLNNAKFVNHQKSIYEEWGQFNKVGDQVIFEAKTDNYMIITVCDHVSLVSHTGSSPKPEIDAIVKSAIAFRDIAKGTYIWVQQLNRSSQSTDRLKTEASSEINLSDFRDTSDTCNASEVVLGLFNPYREKMSTHRGYKITGDGLIYRYRSILILKNRYGESEGAVATQFIGEVGDFNQLPKSSDMTSEDYKFYRAREEDEAPKKVEKKGFSLPTLT